MLVGQAAALALSGVTLAAVVWLMNVIASMRRRPVVIDGRELMMRAGTLRSFVVPIRQIAGLRASWDLGDPKERSVRNLALVSYPNVVVDLTQPLNDRRGTRAIAHRLDDPGGFARALTSRLDQAGTGSRSPSSTATFTPEASA